MPLTPQQREAVDKWMKERATSARCPACGANEWTSANELCVLLNMESGNIFFGGGVPVLPVACNQCGMVMMFSAIVLGIFTPPKPSLPPT